MNVVENIYAILGRASDFDTIINVYMLLTVYYQHKINESFLKMWGATAIFVKCQG
jgi:hypothetical protein